MLPTLALAMLALQVAATAAQVADALHPNLVLTLAQSLVYLGAVLLLLRGAPIGMGWVLTIAVLLRLTVLFLPPFHSTDIYRYVWDGRVQGAAINPYLYVPNDAALTWLRDPAVWPRINRADYAPTIYPPAAQALFFLITRLSAGVIGMKVVWVMLEGATAWAIVHLLDHLRLPREQLLIYAWSPLAIWETAGAGHVDAAMAALVALAVLARMHNRDGLAGLALGLAVLVKFLPLVILPALWRRWDWRLPACFAATVVLGYLPYLGAGAKVLGFLPRYAGEEGFQDGTGFWIARLIGEVTGTPIPSLAYLAGVACVMGGVALATVLNGAVAPLKGALVLAATAMVALSPASPWYFLWLVPFLCGAPTLPVLGLTAASPLLYWANARTVPWMSDVLYGGMCVMALATLLLRFSDVRSRSA